MGASSGARNRGGPMPSGRLGMEVGKPRRASGSGTIAATMSGSRLQASTTDQPTIDPSTTDQPITRPPIIGHLAANRRGQVQGRGLRATGRRREARAMARKARRATWTWRWIRKAKRRARAEARGTRLSWVVNRSRHRGR